MLVLQSAAVALSQLEAPAVGAGDVGLGSVVVPPDEAPSDAAPPDDAPLDDEDEFGMSEPDDPPHATANAGKSPK